MQPLHVVFDTYLADLRDTHNAQHRAWTRPGVEWRLGLQQWEFWNKRLQRGNRVVVHEKCDQRSKLRFQLGQHVTWSFPIHPDWGHSSAQSSSELSRRTSHLLFDRLDG